MFDRARFDRFIRNLVIDTKESGQVPLRMIGTQRYFLDEMQKGLADDYHFFVVLKGRQLGISTISLALDLFWLFQHNGLQGMLATDSDGNRNFFKQVLSDYITSLPRPFRRPIISHNRNLLSLGNRSKLHYLTAGSRKTGSGNMGRGKGLNFLHATEVSSWGDEEGFNSLMSTLAQKQPDRLYIFESTARSFNMFYDLWTDAKASMTQKAIFIGWWRNEFYRAEKGSPIYNVYWDGHLKGEESEWVNQVKAFYDYDIQPEQIAWWRYQSEEMLKEGTMMMQEYPPTEEYAFVVSGQHFFSGKNLTETYKAIEASPNPKYYRYSMGSTFDTMDLIETNAENATLKIWEEPVPNGVYVLGCDPAYGSSENADRFAIQVLRCYSDGVEQVAEYCTPQGYMYSFAWIIAHLAGAYRNSTVLMELNGPGVAVFQEFRALIERAKGVRAEHAKNFRQVIGNIGHFLYRRADSTSGGAPVLHYKTTAEAKERIMNRLRDNFERGTLKVRSRELVGELRYITNDSGYIGASGRAKDDLTVAMALAIECWSEQVFPTLQARGLTRVRSIALQETTSADDPATRMVSTYLKKLGMDINAV
jgi:hypothetical protein